MLDILNVYLLGDIRFCTVLEIDSKCCCLSLTNSIVYFDSMLVIGRELMFPNESHARFPVIVTVPCICLCIINSRIDQLILWDITK